MIEKGRRHARAMMNFTSSRAKLMEHMIVYGPQTFAYVHRSWLCDLRVLRRHRLVSFYGGVWRATRLGRSVFKQRTGFSWKGWV